MFVYIAGRYSADTIKEREANALCAIYTGILVEQAGHHAVIPHLSHYTDLQAKSMGVEIEYEHWIRHGLEQLSMCDAMLVISESPGVKREIDYAREHFIPIYYSLEEMIKNESNH